MFIQPINGNSIPAPTCQYCACHWEFRKMNKTVVIREIKIQWVQTFTYMIDYLINFNHFTHIPLVLIYLHLQFLIFKWVPLRHMATFLFLCSLSQLFLKTLFQLHLFGIAKIHTVLQVNLAGSGSTLLQICFVRILLLELKSTGQWAKYLGNHVQQLLELFVHLKK